MNKLNYKEMQRYCNEVNKYKVGCECGHKVFMPHGVDTKICNWCGRKVYKNDMIKFKYVLRNKLKEYDKILIQD